MFETTICIRLVLSRGLLSWQTREDSHEIKIPDDLRYYYKSLGVPQVVSVLCEWSFSLHLISRSALAQAVEGVGDVCMLNYRVKNVCRYRCSAHPVDLFFHAFVFTINIPTAATAGYLLLPTYYVFVSEWFCSANKQRGCLTRHRCSFVEVWDTLQYAGQRDCNTAVKEFQFAATLSVACSCSRGANCSHWLTRTPLLDVNILETTTDGAAEETFVHGFRGGIIGDDNGIRCAVTMHLTVFEKRNLLLAWVYVDWVVTQLFCTLKDSRSLVQLVCYITLH